MKTSTTERLRGEGHRITRVRAALVGILEKSHGPFSVPQLLSSLRTRGVRANKTTVYRELEFLLRHTFIREVNLGERQTRYELNHDGHHHHLVCLTCRSVDTVDLPEDLDAHEQHIKKTKGFAVSRHALEFFGKCVKCR